MRVIKGEDLFKHIDEYDVILVGTNTYCTMSQGFQRDIMLHYPHVQERNMETRYGDKSKLGTIVQVEGKPTFVLLYICEGNFRPDLKKDYLDYEALSKCAKISSVLFKDKKVACPLLGSSRFDGNGDHDVVSKILSDAFKTLDVDIYDYFQKSKLEKLKEVREKELAVKAVDRAAYYKMVAERKEREKKIKELNGHTRT